MELYNGQQNWTNRIDSPSNITAERVARIVGWVTFGVGLPAIFLAIYMLSQLVKGGNGTPVQAINLLISDIFSLFTRPQTISGSTTIQLETDIPSLIFYFGVASNVVFMVGVAQERHLLVANEQCHGCCRKAKQSSLISLASWAAPIGIVLLLYFGFHLAFSICLLVPFPLLVFFLLDSCRASLCCPTSVRPSQRRRVLAMLVTILANYTILFLPFALTTLLATLQVQISGYEYFGLAANVLLYVSPVINPFISMLLTRNLRELLDTLPCCRRRCKRTETADSPVVIENPNVDLPLSDTEHSLSAISENATEFLSKGMGMSNPNFENFNASLSMPGTSAEIPTVSGGLPALPHMGATCSQVPTPFGNLTSIPGLPNMGLMASGGPLSSGGQSNNLTVPGLPNMGIGSGGPLSSGGQSSNLTMPGMPNMGLFPSESPSLLANLSQDTTMSGVPNMNLFCNEGPTSSANLAQDATMPQLQNVGQTCSPLPTCLKNLTSVSGHQNVCVNCSQVSAPVGTLSRDGPVVLLPVMGLTCSLTPTHLGNLPRDTTMFEFPVVGLICSQVPALLGNLTRDLTITGTSDQDSLESGITTKL